MTPAALQRLQSAAGNRAASRLIAARRPASPRTGPQARPPSAGPAAPNVQRLATGTETPVPRTGPESDPKFDTLKAEVKAKQQTTAKHPPAQSEAQAAQAAARPPQDDKEAQGKTANAEKMNAAKPGEFDKAGFIKAVNDAIAAQAPKNLDEAEKFKPDAVKGQVQGQVGDGKKASAGLIESATKAPPDTAAAKEKQVTPHKADQPPPTPGTPDAGKAIPDKAPPSATDFSDGPKQVDDQMSQAEVTEDQLAKSNEPEFTGALQDKQEGEKHAAAAPGLVRKKEAETLAGAKAQATQTGATAMTKIAADRTHAGAQVSEDKDGTKSKDETQRAQVTAKLQKVFDATKKEVEDILSGLDKKVDEKFTKEEKAARDAFAAEHQQKMDEYKDKRYSGWTGKLKWVKDKFSGLPAEANQIFVQARKGYVDRMQQVISGIADLIGGELNRAKQRIATGRAELQAEVGKLSPELQAIGKEAAGKFASKFDELTESVDAKGTELVNTLAGKYNEALKSVDDEIAAEKEKNKGLIAKAVDAVKGVINTILKLKDMLLGVLAKAASAVLAIIKDPIGFLGHLVSSVGAGLRQFLANIGDHLKKGLVGWLMGAMASAGLELPAKFDLRGIIGMIGSLLGLTWASIKGRVISRGVPAAAVDKVEESVPLAQKVRAEGIGGIWEMIKEKVGDLKANLFAKISEYLIPTVLIAGITWIVSLLNPASAFIKACKMIVDIVTFIVERGAQIIEFVNSVLDAIIAITRGGAGGVPALIENALAKSIPVLIGALSAILGIGGIADKVKKFFQSLSKPVMKAVDWVVDKIVTFGKKIWAKLKGAGKKLKDKFGKKKDDGKEREPSIKDKEKIAQKAADDGYRAASQVPLGKIPDALADVHSQWRPQGLKSLAMVPLGNHSFTVEASVNPKAQAKNKGTVDLDVQPEMLSMDQVAATSFASSTTAASGAFEADCAPELTEIMTSGATPKDLILTDSQEGAHAEEQVVNKFNRGWNTRTSEIARALPEGKTNAQKWFEKTRMSINVSKSSCINCASYIARFAQALQERSSSVQVDMKFASLYHGAQEVPKSNMDDFGDIVRLFVENGRLKGTNRHGRLWGLSSLFGDRKERVTDVSRGKAAGKAGLAILRNAGINVQVLSQEDVEGKSNAEARERLQMRNEKLQRALAEVDRKLEIKKD
jgi:hypothetical protein